MRHRRLARYYDLARPRLRLTWNKKNLYNIVNYRLPRLTSKTFFQQKWLAKAATRGYHGEHVKESQWERMFSRRIRSVVNMEPAYMAQHDGSEHAEGRGSGKIRSLEENPRSQTPHMQMTFAPLERRLDIAIFRAMFASSARQARQFVIHGAVKVNGKKMIYPGYLLNPGDMFQVDIDKVLYATGKPKRQDLKTPPQESEEGEEVIEEEAVEETAVEGVEGEEAVAEGEASTEEDIETLKKIRAAVKAYYKANREQSSAKQKVALRAILKESKAALAAAAKADANVGTVPYYVDKLTDLVGKLKLNSETQEEDKQASEEIHRALQEVPETLAKTPNQIKPYLVPWRPREFLPAFAFIPRYLEVNQKICAAVYLRHPVAREGMAEVPTPFPRIISQLAFNWYLRRG
ncbi:mitochondrial 37S ribosomal protein nam9 [Echria macrotheca]|uniref:Small ribosomal subunit protein uS4m n=1 Tax=Echria macrotheca TaxID=438768 RepID=A0AAJ0BJD9_9PEZI|nr:mitochondrial 37S ribosomal protein nam9 [Echria macrotheca]